VLDEAVEEKAGGEKVRIGMVVRISPLPETGPSVGRNMGADWDQVIRGNSVVMLEALERIGGDGGGGGQR